MSEGHIKSPFHIKTTKEIRKTTNINEIADGAINGFNYLLKTCEETNRPVDAGTFFSYMAGLIAGLKIMGFSASDMHDITNRVRSKIEEITESDEECDCPNCRKEK